KMNREDEPTERTDVGKPSWLQRPGAVERKSKYDGSFASKGARVAASDTGHRSPARGRQRGYSGRLLGSAARAERAADNVHHRRAVHPERRRQDRPAPDDRQL